MLLGWIRQKFGPVIIGAIIVLITFVFVFYGVFNPKSTRGLHEGAVAGTVNGDPISIQEFSRAYNQRVEFFKSMMGGKVSEEQLKAFRLKASVFQELVRRKVMAAEAKKVGLVASDDEVKQKVAEIPAFKKDGKFDLMTYKKVLEANGLSPGGFEVMIRDDLAMMQWSEFIKRRVFVSEDEIAKQFELNNNKRNIRYVLLTQETGKKDIVVLDTDLTAFFADAAKVNLAKSQFESRKETDFKGKTFDQVKVQLAKEVLAGSKFDEIKKNNEKLGDRIAELLTADSKGDAKLNALIKPYKLEAKLTGLVSRQSQFLPGIGEAKDLVADAFADPSPIIGKPKKYTSASWVLVALVTESQKPEMAKLKTERTQILEQISSKKERELLEDWVKRLVDKAKVDENADVVGSEA